MMNTKELLYRDSVNLCEHIFIIDLNGVILQPQ